MARKRRLVDDENTENASNQASRTWGTLKESSRIDSANALQLSAFRTLYISQPTYNPKGTGNGIVAEHTLSIETAKSMSPTDFQACYDLIKVTSSEAYKNSSVGWSSTKKKKEMKLPDLRYLLVKRANGSEDVAVVAFLSLMLTIEDNHEVVYCYEVHVSERVRGCGLGKHLMDTMETVGRSVGVEKVMLTVFLKNEAGIRFYERLGYTEDDFSPPAKRLRNGLLKRPNYVILSKALR
ncbi:MAG: hypothetical protein M1812_006999 [Candelaria pacifica]|nr:MAG: hypothetical protein M1812_006999 [Candelaria pacifica]